MQCLLQVYLSLCGGTVFVCPTHIDAVVTSAAAVSCIHISTQHTPDNIAQMGNIVDIGEGACDQDVSLACTNTNHKQFQQDRHAESWRAGKLFILFLAFHLNGKQRKDALLTELSFQM